MSALPSAMQAKKAKLLQVTLPALDQQQPSSPNAPKPVAELPPLTDDEMKAFTVDEAAPAAVGDAPAPAPVPTPSPAPAPSGASPTPSPAPAPEGDTTDWKWRFHSLEGTHNVLVRENRAMREDVVRLEEQVQNLIKAKPAPASTPTEMPDLSDEEKEVYSGSVPVIEKIALRKAHQLIESAVAPLKATIEELRQANQNVVKQVTNESEGTFLASVRHNVPDMEQIVSTAEWKDFIARPVSPYASQSIAQAMWAAHGARDLTKVTRVFEDFKKGRVQPTVTDAFRGPSVSGAAGVLPDGKKPMLKISGREDVSKKFRKGQITREEYMRVKRMYDEAEAENRIDYNK